MATDSMTVKITPNGRGNPMTFTEHRRFNDHEIAQAATPTRSTESSAPEDPAFERHYRIGELADKWHLGRETVRLLVKDERGVIKPTFPIWLPKIGPTLHRSSSPDRMFLSPGSHLMMPATAT